MYHLYFYRTFWTGLHTGRCLAGFDAIVAHVAFGDDVALFMKDGHVVGAVPGAILAADADIVVVKDDAITHLFISVGGTAFEAGRIYAVVAAHGQKELQGIGKLPAFGFADSSPFNVCWVVVLLVAGHLAAVAADALGGVEVEAVLLPLF